MEAMQPEFEDESPINPFDFWQGANFKLKIVKKDGFWNYDKSEFDSVAPLLDDDDALKRYGRKSILLLLLLLQISSRVTKILKEDWSMC